MNDIPNFAISTNVPSLFFRSYCLPSIPTDQRGFSFLPPLPPGLVLTTCHNRALTEYKPRTSPQLPHGHRYTFTCPQPCFKTATSHLSTPHPQSAIPAVRIAGDSETASQFAILKTGQTPAKSTSFRRPSHHASRKGHRLTATQTTRPAKTPRQHIPRFRPARFNRRIRARSCACASASAGSLPHPALFAGQSLAYTHAQSSVPPIPHSSYGRESTAPPPPHSAARSSRPFLSPPSIRVLGRMTPPPLQRSRWHRVQRASTMPAEARGP
jgi:hypothetical protein